MGRLIDADRLNKDFSIIITHIENSNKETISKEEFCKCLKILRECVDEQPTAYNVEKVVAALEEMKDCLKVPQKVCDIYSDCGLCYVGRAIDIVKAGGVDD